MGSLDESAPYFADYFVIVRQWRLGNPLAASGPKTLATSTRMLRRTGAEPLKRLRDGQIAAPRRPRRKDRPWVHRICQRRGKKAGV